MNKPENAGFSGVSESDRIQNTETAAKTLPNNPPLIYRLLPIMCLLLLCNIDGWGQDLPLTQTIRGTVTDAASGASVPYATVVVNDLPDKGAMTDSLGRFVLERIPLGRHSLRASSLGYAPAVAADVLLTSAREVYLEMQLKESVTELGEVVVQAQTDRSQPLNRLALTGAHLLSVEQAARYAGGMDDPARLVSSFAGVSAGISSNGISVHGNAPQLLQWRLEDVEIPNPNHFADIAVLGGGILSSLSSLVLGNSDFFSGAFTAEYNNAVSGVFDMKLRNGNNQRRENTFQVGVLGIDAASEGPLTRHHRSSYIFNYRYSTTGLLSKLDKSQDLGGTLDYQDLNFKLNFPTARAGTFSVWGTGFIDKFVNDRKEPDEWKYKDENKQSEAQQDMASGGISHRYFFPHDALLKTTAAITWFRYKAREDNADAALQRSPWGRFDNRNLNLILTTSFNRKFSAWLTNKSGFTLTGMFYDLSLSLAPLQGQPLQSVADEKGNTVLLSAYNTSFVQVNERLSLNFGLSAQYLTLNRHWTLEPRLAAKWQASPESALAVAYGLHSRMEKTDIYFITQNGVDNRKLDFTKAHHLQLSYTRKLADHLHLRIEPYFQYLFRVPVIADSSWSVLNRKEFYARDLLVNRGKGINAGIDLTLEKFLHRGLYYMFTGSVFQSRYCGGDGRWHNTRFNRNFVANLLGGKEWMLGRKKQRLLSLNLKLTLQGGDRYSPFLREATLNHPDYEVQYDNDRAYSRQFSPDLIVNYTVSYRINRRRVAHEFALKAINAGGCKEYYGHQYNLKTGTIEPERHATALTNISYKLEF